MSEFHFFLQDETSQSRAGSRDRQVAQRADEVAFGPGPGLFSSSLRVHFCSGFCETELRWKKQLPSHREFSPSLLPLEKKKGAAVADRGFRRGGKKEGGMGKEKSDQAGTHRISSLTTTPAEACANLFFILMKSVEWWFYATERRCVQGFIEKQGAAAWRNRWTFPFQEPSNQISIHRDGLACTT